MTLPLATALATDPGCHRDGNEDSGCVIRPPDAALLARKGVLVAVADGMGGHQSGEIASKLALEIVSRVYYECAEDVPKSLVTAFQKANRAVWMRARERAEYQGMGTTCTALVVQADLAYAAHVGDSRLYLVRDGRIFQMTEDHSLVGDMVRRGLLTVEEASRHEDRNVIVRALGTREDLEVSTWNEPFPVRAGDRFVVCSDGLYDLVADAEIQNVAGAVEPQMACQVLVRAARHRGGYDNITVAVVGVGPAAGERPGMRATRESELPI